MWLSEKNFAGWGKALNKNVPKYGENPKVKGHFPYINHPFDKTKWRLSTFTMILWWLMLLMKPLRRQKNIRKNHLDNEFSWDWLSPILLLITTTPGGMWISLKKHCWTSYDTPSLPAKLWNLLHSLKCTGTITNGIAMAHIAGTWNHGKPWEFTTISWS